jgi:hypothetical protein
LFHLHYRKFSAYKKSLLFNRNARMQQQHAFML